MYQRSTYFNKISTDLTILAHTISNKNKLSLTDDDKWSEDFFKDLLNKIYGYQLVNLNTKEQNYAGIDLGDSINHICVQVTASNSSQKIKDTLAISDKYNREQEYNNLIILIIGWKKKLKSTFCSKFSTFDGETSIWDIRNLLSKIFSLNADQMKSLMDFIDSELDGVITIDPLELSDADASLIIDLLFEYVQKNLNKDIQESKQKYILIKRDDDFISRKNKLNNVDDVLFNGEIRQSLQYDKAIETFLSNPINSDYQKKYFAITEAFQKNYSENSDQFKNIGDLFGFVFDGVINYDNRNEADDRKLLIILHNMYFNCDIGNNPR
ncbi:MAG: ABC-three component system protein [Minisyncoccia bacterium]